MLNMSTSRAGSLFSRTTWTDDTACLRALCSQPVWIFSPYEGSSSTFLNYFSNFSLPTTPARGIWYYTRLQSSCLLRFGSLEVGQRHRRGGSLPFFSKSSIGVRIDPRICCHRNHAGRSFRPSFLPWYGIRTKVQPRKNRLCCLTGQRV
jgi:hypothetical protein